MLGVLVMKMPVDRINTIMQQHEGLGETGETVLIGADRKMRSQSRLSESPTTLITTVTHEAASAALAGQRGVKLVKTSDGSGDLLVGYAPLAIEGLHWSILTSIRGDEAFAVMNRVIMARIVISAGVVLVLLPMVLWLVRSLLRRLGADPERLEQVANAIASGTLNSDFGDEKKMSGVFGAMHTMQAQIKDRIDSERMVAELQKEVIDDTVRVLGGMAQGNFSQHIEGDYDGAFKQLKIDVNTTVDKLTDVSSEIKNAAEQVSKDAQCIDEGNDNLTAAAERQAASLEETASSMEEITATVAKTADNADHAKKGADDARVNAESGGEVVGRAIEAMTGINQSSKKIADIISVIDEIAFQTNLLALNAAVEAARAGEQGRGFAVVAAEVRNLAGRSAEAAKQIKALIEDSVNRVEEGSKLVDESGKALADIVGSVSMVTEIVTEIAAACREQSVGIDMVSSAITQLDQVTHENVTAVQAAASASGSMGVQAQRLKELVAFFHSENESQSTEVENSDDSPVDRRSAARPWKPVTAQPDTPSSTPGPAQAQIQAVASARREPEWEEF